LVFPVASQAKIFDRDTLRHLRLPFSFFLLPIFCFAISQSTHIDLINTTIIFIVLHFFIYPGSNIYNSYMDEDKGSIGGLKHPPPVTKKLYYASIIFDITGLILCLIINLNMVLLMLVYVGVSKAYSWKKIRLKKYGYTGWLVVMLFQGGYTFLLVSMASENLFEPSWFSAPNFECMVIASLLIGGFYPLTQIYQHEEDGERGDYTISYKLGIRGTLLFSGILFLLSSIVAWHYFKAFYSSSQFLIFIFSLIPVILYFFYWSSKIFRNKTFADYKHTMQITFISSACMIVCWSVIFCLNCASKHFT
jgi:1,4-dihydroxy-2-naphthoate octaprenyltransferase